MAEEAGGGVLSRRGGASGSAVEGGVECEEMAASERRMSEERTEDKMCDVSARGESAKRPRESRSRGRGRTRKPRLTAAERCLAEVREEVDELAEDYNGRAVGRERVAEADAHLDADAAYHAP